MPSYQVSVPHSLGQEAARVRVASFLESVQRDYAAHVSEVQGQWDGADLEFGFVASGLRVNGKMQIEETVVVVAGPLPLAAALFRGQIERTIREQLQRLLT